MDFTGLYKKVKALKIENLMDRAVMLNDTSIIDANTAQLSKGLMKDGNNIDEYHSDSYAKYKKQIGSKAPLGIPDLHLDGGFYEGFYLKVDSEGYQIGSTDNKESDLQNKYSSKIFGLTDESKSDLKPQIQENLIELIKNKL